MVERELPKLLMAVRFRSPAQNRGMAFLFLCAVACAGCTSYVEAPRPPMETGEGFYHRVVRGETLWSISRQYGVELERVIEVNRIFDAQRVEVDQKLWIPKSPGAAVPVEKTAPPPVISGEMDSDPFIWPVEGKVISTFGMRRHGTINKGIDIRASLGADVVAARSGVVSFVHQNLPGFGKTIILDHKDRYATVYAYLGEVLVQQGDRVSRRQVIGRVGRTGRADVPALHFEVRRVQKAKNPFYYLP